VLRIFARVQKRPHRGSYTGYGKRQPSDKAPVMTPREVAVLASGGADAGHSNGTASNGGASNGGSSGVGTGAIHSDSDPVVDGSSFDGPPPAI
jgi:cell division protease FtsH